MSIIRDPDTYEKFENIILTHTVRTVKELAYRDLLENLNNDETYSEVTKGNLNISTQLQGKRWDRKEKNYKVDKRILYGMRLKWKSLTQKLIE